MGYRIRVLGLKLEQPSIEYLRVELEKVNADSVLILETGTTNRWEQLILTHRNGPEIALIEHNPVLEGELGEEELQEFIAELDHYQPATAAEWLRGYLPRVKSIYALQLLSGTEIRDGWKLAHRLQGAIWEHSGGILQSDGEGFTNESGYHILWQFSDKVKGKWNMAVLKETGWVKFEMELGDMAQRKAFLEGSVPSSARLLS